MHPRFLSIVVLLVAGMTAFSSSPALAKAPTSTSSPEELRAYLTKLEGVRDKVPKLEYLMSRGQTLEDLGRYDEALKEYSDAVGLQPTNWRCIECRSRLYGKLNRWNEAVADRTKLIDLGVEVSTNLALRGIARLKLKDKNGALKDAERALELDDQNATAWCCKGDAQMESGDNQSAINSFSRAIQIEPDEWSGYYYRALAYRELKQMDFARKELKLARQHGWKSPKLGWEK
ncbi:MAG: tetratricopeptide repeat protein [Cyanobacteria bacterium]|nr:tetratricopeptide repeat protein [Cyanobacteriota bacterium]